MAVLRRRPAWWIAGLAVLVASGAVAYIGFWAGVPVVQVTRPERRDLAERITEEGTVIPAAQEVVAVEQGGRIAHLAVEEGDLVQAGDLIAEIDVSGKWLEVRSLEARLASAEAALAQARAGVPAEEIRRHEAAVAAAQAELRAAEGRVAQVRLQYIQGQIDHEGYRQAVEARNAAEARLNQAQALLDAVRRGPDPHELRRLQAGVDEIRAQLERARQDLESSRLVAPMEGIVLERPVEPGAVVAPGTVIARIGTPDDLRVEVYVLAADSLALASGQPVTLTGRVLDGKTVPGRIVSVAPAAVTRRSELGVDEDRVRVEVEPVEAAGLKPGFRVDVEFVTASAENVLALPAEAVLPDEETAAVFVVEDGIARRRPVELGILDDAYFEIRAGLSGQEKVIVNPPRDLEDGMRVRVAAED